MKKNLLSVFLIIFTCAALTGCASVPPPPQTIINDEAEAAMLLGKHLYTNHILNGGTDYFLFGAAHIENDNGVYRITAEHREVIHFNMAWKEAYIKMDGIITEISPLSFTFKGDMTSYYYLEGDGPCTETGTFRFSRRGHPPYWRHRHSCYDSLLEYVDIFTRHEKD